MTLTVGALLALSFLISVLGLFMFIWAQTRGLMRAGPEAAQVIFEAGELGIVEEPGISSTQRGALQRAESNANASALRGDAQRAAHTRPDLLAREAQDRSSRAAAFAFLTSSILWLVLGSLAGLVALPTLSRHNHYKTHGRLLLLSFLNVRSKR
jgi:cytochrome c oxidase cbb3-type subunit 1